MLQATARLKSNSLYRHRLPCRLQKRLSVSIGHIRRRHSGETSNQHLPGVALILLGVRRSSLGLFLLCDLRI